MRCTDYRADLSAYADAALDARRAGRVRAHLGECRACADELKQLAGMRTLLRAHARVPAPPDLALALRVRLSRERHHRWLGSLVVRLENLLEPVAVPAVAGLFAAVLLFGVLVQTIAIPAPGLAQTDDVPLTLTTKPRLRDLGSMHFANGDQRWLVEVRVDHEGRVADYKVLDGSSDPADMDKLRRMLLFTRFDPATAFGVPRQATTIISLSSISVKG